MPTIVANEEREWTKEMQAQWEHDEYIIKKWKEKELQQKEHKAEHKVASEQIQPCVSDVRLDLVNHAYRISG
jgi:hypothetical protein